MASDLPIDLPHLNELMGPTDDIPKVSDEEAVQIPLVFLAYSYHSVPHYVEELRGDLADRGYLLFDPLTATDDQFPHVGDVAQWQARQSALLPSEVALSPDDPRVTSALKRGDDRTDVDSMMFKELYFLARSSVVLCDLVIEPYGCELFHKIFYAKVLGIPVVGISPLGKGVSAYVQKYLKVLLTDDFNTENIIPLIKAYT